MPKNLTLHFKIVCRKCGIERAVRTKDYKILPASEAHK